MTTNAYGNNATAPNAAINNMPANQQQFQATYMQSGAVSLANTQTTKSAAEYASCSTQQQPANVAAQVAPSMPAATAPVNKPKISSNIDLLSDIDFSGDAAIPPPILPEPALKPQVISSAPASEAGDNQLKNQEQQKVFIFLIALKLTF